MQTILYFDICAIPIFVIILITIFVRKLTKGKSNLLFLALITLSLAATVTDVITELLWRSLPMQPAEILFGNIFINLYYLFRTSSVLVYLFFIFSVTGTWYRIRRKRIKALMFVPYAILLLTLLSNAFTGAVYTIRASTGYSRGPMITVLYAVSLLYAFFGTFYLISCRRFLTVEKLISLLSLNLMTLGSAIWQYFFPQYLIEMISSALATVLIILFVLRPEEVSDASVDTLSFEAYKTELRKVLLTKQKVRIAAIQITNAAELRSYLGEERYLSYVAHVIKLLNSMFIRERIFFNIYFEHPGNIYIIVDTPDYDIRDAYRRLYTELRRRLEQMDASGERIRPKGCGIRIPDDLNNFDDIIKFGREFADHMGGDTVFADAADIICSQDYKIVSNMDAILNRAISGSLFRMYYQPIYSFDRGKFISAEALIRLFDDEFGFVSPALFIPAAEKRGVILPIGDFVLEEVHRFISENDFDELGLEYIEINLSVAQCLQDELPEKLAALSDKYGVSPDKVNLEITETTYEEMGSTMSVNLKALADMGYTFSLDDYGTGYSNMQRVSRLPLKMIKLDKSLVDDMISEDGRAIMRNTVKMMRDIDKELVAEGVETKDRLDDLHEMGCHFIQGYYFSKPLPPAEFVSFLKTHNSPAH